MYNALKTSLISMKELKLKQTIVFFLKWANAGKLQISNPLKEIYWDSDNQPQNFSHGHHHLLPNILFLENSTLGQQHVGTFLLEYGAEQLSSYEKCFATWKKFGENVLHIFVRGCSKAAALQREIGCTCWHSKSEERVKGCCSAFLLS